MARKAPTMAEINAQTVALNKRLGTKPYVQPPKTTPKRVAAATPVVDVGLKQRAQNAFQRVREDAQTTRRKNIDAIVDGTVKPRRK